MRGTDDEEEARALEREFKLLSPEERRTLYADRKGHKDIVMFLHEWGHTMGLLHNEDRSIFMNPSYDARETAFSDFERHVIALVLERRLARRAELYPESADLLPLLETAPHEEGSDSDRARLLELARGRARARTRRIGAPAGAGLPAPDVEAFNQAVEAANAGRLEDAWKLLSPVLQRAGTRKAGGGPLPGETWLRLAELAAGAGALSAADDAATRAGAQDPEALKLSAKIESTRHRIALPLDAAQRGVPPDREPAYVAGYNQMAAAINSSSSVADMARARSLLRDFAAAFPGAPGADVLGCDLELKARRPAVATRSCEAALDKFKGATRAHYLLAFMATSGATAAHKPAVAEQHLRQVIAMDPSDADAWRALVRLYRETRAKRSLAELAEQHQALLSSPLPE
jgi:hypothetical protein